MCLRWCFNAVLKVLDLFAGIGGFSLGLERTGGFETVAFCEIDPFCRKVLAKHWPSVPIYSDVNDLNPKTLVADGITPGIITGGFPCQDISTAGNRAGLEEGARSGLWSEIARLVGDIRPQYVILENVANLLAGPTEQRGGWFGRVLSDLAAIGYDAEWHVIPASATGLCHVRSRVWIIAYPTSIRRLHKDTIQNSIASERVRQRLADHASYFHSKVLREISLPPDFRVSNGFPEWMDPIKSLGNSVIPQIPEIIGRAILDAEKINLEG